MKIPKSEIQWVEYRNSDGNITHIMTSGESRGFYMLYEKKGEDFVKLGKAKSPSDLEDKFLIKKKRGKKGSE